MQGQNPLRNMVRNSTIRCALVILLGFLAGFITGRSTERAGNTVRGGISGIGAEYNYINERFSSFDEAIAGFERSTAEISRTVNAGLEENVLIERRVSDRLQYSLQLLHAARERSTTASASNFVSAKADENSIYRDPSRDALE